MNADEHWEKALRASEAARALIAIKNTEGAVNRAYYAMFAAARAALYAVDPNFTEAKTHSTVLRRFSQNVVMAHGLDRNLGRILRKAEKSSLEADYDSAPPSLERAEAILENMQTLLGAIERFLFGDIP